MLKKTITTGLVTGLILAGLSQGASGYSISYNQVIWQGEDAGVFDPTQLSASIDMQMVDSNTFTILLTNTTLFSENIDDFDFPATIALTGIGFNLSSNPYYDIIGGSVYGADSIYYSDGWGYDNNPLEGGPFLLGEVTTKDVDTVVSNQEAAV